MMDLKESIKNIIKQSTKFLKKLEADESADDSDDDIEIIEKIIEDSKAISTQLKSKRTKPRLNGNGRTTVRGDDDDDDDSRSSSIKLVPIEQLMQKGDQTVLGKPPIELSGSDSDELINSSSSKSKSDDTVRSTSKASILKGVFNPVKVTATKGRNRASRTATGTRKCSVNMTRTNLSRLVASEGLELMPTVNDAPTTKPTKTVRSFSFRYCYVE